MITPIIHGLFPTPVMFPSELQHMVEQKQGKNLRTSLSFNTFIRGDIGNNGELTELKLV